MNDDDEEEENTFGVVRYPCMPSLVALQQMRNRLHLAFLGRKLMKWTALATGRELRRLAAKLYEACQGFSEDIHNAFIMLARSRYYFPQLNHIVTEDIPKNAAVLVQQSMKAVSGVKQVQFQIIETGNPPYSHLGIGKGGQMISETKKTWMELLKRIIMMMQLRANFITVELANRNATKKWNVLSKMIIPRINLSCHYIVSELEEIEREDNFRLKRFKELKTKKNKVVKEDDICKNDNCACQKLEISDSPEPCCLDYEKHSSTNRVLPDIQKQVSENVCGNVDIMTPKAINLEDGLNKFEDSLSNVSLSKNVEVTNNTIDIQKYIYIFSACKDMGNKQKSNCKIPCARPSSTSQEKTNMKCVKISGSEDHNNKHEYIFASCKKTELTCRCPSAIEKLVKKVDILESEVKFSRSYSKAVCTCDQFEQQNKTPVAQIALQTQTQTDSARSCQLSEFQGDFKDDIKCEYIFSACKKKDIDFELQPDATSIESKEFRIDNASSKNSCKGYSKKINGIQIKSDVCCKPAKYKIDSSVSSNNSEKRPNKISFQDKGLQTKLDKDFPCKPSSPSMSPEALVKKSSCYYVKQTDSQNAHNPSSENIRQIIKTFKEIVKINIKPDESGNICIQQKIKTTKTKKKTFGNSFTSEKKITQGTTPQSLKSNYCSVHLPPCEKKPSIPSKISQSISGTSTDLVNSDLSQSESENVTLVEELTSSVGQNVSECSNKSECCSSNNKSKLNIKPVSSCKIKIIAKPDDGSNQNNDNLTQSIFNIIKKTLFNISQSVSMNNLTRDESTTPKHTPGSKGNIPLSNCTCQKSVHNESKSDHRCKSKDPSKFNSFTSHGSNYACDNPANKSTVKKMVSRKNIFNQKFDKLKSCNCKNNNDKLKLHTDTRDCICRKDGNQILQGPVNESPKCSCDKPKDMPKINLENSRFSCVPTDVIPKCTCGKSEVSFNVKDNLPLGTTNAKMKFRECICGKNNTSSAESFVYESNLDAKFCKKPTSPGTSRASCKCKKEKYNEERKTCKCEHSIISAAEQEACCCKSLLTMPSVNSFSAESAAGSGMCPKCVSSQNMISVAITTHEEDKESKQITSQKSCCPKSQKRECKCFNETKDATTLTRRSDKYDVRPLRFLMEVKTRVCTCKSDSALLKYKNLSRPIARCCSLHDERKF